MKYVLASVIFCAGWLAAVGVSRAQPDYTKKERVQCTVCHEGSWNSGKYTSAGKYYQEHHTFKGYRPPQTNPAKPKKTA